jgi:hypothetical protein
MLTIVNRSGRYNDAAPHTYELANNHSEQRTAQLIVWRDSTVVRTRSITFQPNSSVRITAYRAGSYTIVVDPHDAPRHVIEDPTGWDCNSVRVLVELRPDGAIVGTWIRTSLGC